MNLHITKYEFISKSTGYTLPFVLFISVIISGFLLLIFRLLLYQNMDQKSKENKKQLDFACYSVVQKILADEEFMGTVSEEIPFTEIEVIVTKKQFGLFYNLTATAKNPRDSSIVQYSVANVITPKFTNALIISKPNLRATVAGNTVIRGNILATSDNFSIGHIYGIEKTNPNFLLGKIYVEPNIPSKKFSDSLLLKTINHINFPEGYDQIIHGDMLIGNSELNKYPPGISTLVDGDMVISGNLSFEWTQKPTVYHVRGKVTFEINSRSDAELIIYSDSTVTIMEEANLENCLIVSKKSIAINKGSVLKNVQIYSQGGITIEQSDLLYPSVLGLYVDVSDTSALRNRLEAFSSNINGTILLISSVVGYSGNSSRITIDESTKFQGLIYCENNLELLGAVQGVVYTYSLWYYKEPTEYKNWLVGINIDRSALDKEFLMPIGLNNKSDLKIFKEKWIH